jgi:hypothetical protein
MAGWYDLREYPDGVEFQLRASNGGLLLNGARRPTREEARNALEQVRMWVGDPLHIERRTNGEGEPYFVVLGSKGEEVAASPPFITGISREYAIESARFYGVSEDVRVLSPSALEPSR